MPTPISQNTVPSLSTHSTTPAQKPTFQGVQAKENEWGHMQLSYTVKAGDTLSRISRQVGTDVDSLVNLNFIENRNLIHPGQALALPTTFHTVKSGETYYGIARSLGINHKTLMALNDAPANGFLRAGQDIRVPAVQISPEQVALRNQLKALVADHAEAQSALYFGPGSFSPRPMGNTLMIQGAAESDSVYEFSNDFKTVKMSFGQKGDFEVAKLQNPVEDLRKLMITDVITSVANSKAYTSAEAWPEFSDAFKVIGPRVEKDVMEFTLTGPADSDTYIAYNLKTGQLSVTDNASQDMGWTKVGNKPSEVARALATKLSMRIPLYAD
jgi:LysM repeat protein